MEPQVEALNDIQRQLVESGWKWEMWTLSKGWWVLPGSEDPAKRIRRGDPKPYLYAALLTAYLYTDIEIPATVRGMV